MGLDGDDNSLPELDLHGFKAAEAQRRLAQELHAARVRGAAGLVVITGRGFGNLEQKPVLRMSLEAWLAGEQAKRLGVLSFRRVRRDGALEIELARRGA